MELKDGIPCGHPGCLHHVSHPCEGCGRITGRVVIEEWRTFNVGDIVSRIGTDEQEIVGINHAGDLIDVKCIKAPHDNFCNVGDVESNIPWRYTLVRRR